MATPDPDVERANLLMAYAGFMMAWACLDELLEVYILQQTRLSMIHATIILSGLGFERKASIARSLMSLRGKALGPARVLLNKIISEAQRNALVHGHLLSFDSPIALAKRTTDQKLTVKILEFDHKAMRTKVNEVTAMAQELQKLLGIDNKDIRRYDKMMRNLANKSATSPKPPS